MICKTAQAARRIVAPIALCLALAAVVGPAAAFAAGNSPSQDQYVPIIHQHVGGSGSSGGSGSGGAGGSGGTPVSPSGGGGGLSGRVGPLPFTGFDVLSMAAVALAVTGLGLGLQRAVSRRPHEDIGDSARL